METMRYLWPLLMVAALIITGLVLKFLAERRKRRSKGIKQHTSLKNVN
ncbi:MAG: hypothetical protein M3R08_02020 [Bacteroidota bacterium]|nr:hypothetical protein [Bacteroidota bacterium]